VVDADTHLHVANMDYKLYRSMVLGEGWCLHSGGLEGVTHGVAAATTQCHRGDFFNFGLKMGFRCNV
jgi:hypothetical protein